jgi:hypothetical protein
VSQIDLLLSGDQTSWSAGAKSEQDLEYTLVIEESEVMMGFWAKLDSQGSIKQLGFVTKDSEGCACEADNLCDENKSLKPCKNDGEVKRSYPQCGCTCEKECDDGFKLRQKDCKCMYAGDIKCKRTERLNHETN